MVTYILVSHVLQHIYTTLLLYIIMLKITTMLKAVCLSNTFKSSCSLNNALITFAVYPATSVDNNAADVG